MSVKVTIDSLAMNVGHIVRISIPAQAPGVKGTDTCIGTLAGVISAQRATRIVRGVVEEQVEVLEAHLTLAATGTYRAVVIPDDATVSRVRTNTTFEGY